MAATATATATAAATASAMRRRMGRSLALLVRNRNRNRNRLCHRQRVGYQRSMVSALSRAQSSDMDERADLTQLLSTMGSENEVNYWLDHYSTHDEYAVVKVGGGNIEDPAERQALTEALAFLKRVGLSPIVLHGAGPQLNAELEKRGIVSEYVEGVRVTTPEILEVALQVFLDTNLILCDALEAAGARARPIHPRVFQSVLRDKDLYGLVGEVQQVHMQPIYDAMRVGCIPVLTSLGMTADGQTLNINGDTAGAELSITAQPQKVVYINTLGSLRDEADEPISTIAFPDEANYLLEQPWVRHGTLLKLREIKYLLDGLPSESSVSITSPQNLMAELFTDQGKGTFCSVQSQIRVIDDVADVDAEKLSEILRSIDNLERKPSAAFMKSLLEGDDAHFHRLYVTESYDACIMLTKQEGTDVPYVDAFAVSSKIQGQGTGERLWAKMTESEPALFWKSPSKAVHQQSHRRSNRWYFDKATGSAIEGDWTVFWYSEGDAFTQDELQKLVRAATDAESIFEAGKSTTVTARQAQSMQRDRPPKPIRSSLSREKVSRPMSSTSLASVFPRDMHTSTQRHFSSSAASGNTRKKVGLIGARGYTGMELIRLIVDHPDLELTAASSRGLKGQSMGDVMASQRDGIVDEENGKVYNFGGATSWPSIDHDGLKEAEALMFEELSPADVAARTDVDLWFLALPNDVCTPFVDELERVQGENHAVLVDLSADHRFVCDHDNTNGWVYGLPERFRERIATSNKIANPGCYATGAQLSLLPLVERGLVPDGALPAIFGMSGYSGAGTSKARSLWDADLADSMLPYKLSDHIHEREVSSQLFNEPGLPGSPRADSPSSSRVRFSPHVASFFRGISLTTTVELNPSSESGVSSAEDLEEMYRNHFAGEPLVRIPDNSYTPQVQGNAGGHHVCIGGFTYHKGQGNSSTDHAVVVTTLDNLLKGAATQALQNANIALGLPELAGLHLPSGEGWEQEGGAQTAAAHAAGVQASLP